MVAVREENLAKRRDADAIAEKVAHLAQNDSRLEHHDFTAWKTLRDLADEVELIDLDVVTESLFLEGDDFAGVCNVVVNLRFDPGAEDELTTEEVFPGKVSGHRVSEYQFAVDDIEVDVRSLYA